MHKLKKSLILSIFLFSILLNLSFANSLDIYDMKYTKPSLNQELNLTFNTSASLTNLRLNLLIPTKQVYDSFSQDNNLFQVPKEYFVDEGVYHFYFSYDPNNLYPKNTIFSFAIYNNTNFTELSKNLMNITNNNYKCNPLNNNLTCGVSSFQTSQILGFSKLYYITQNMTYLNTANNLLISDYVKASEETAGACDASNNDYNCDDINPVLLDSISGPEQQAKNIIYLSDSYKLTKNATFLDYALNYAKGRSSHCDVWQNIFDCNNDTDQALMTLAYLNIYEITNNETFLNIAKNLNNQLSDKNVSLRLLTNYYFDIYTSNSSYSSESSSQKDLFRNECLNQDCNIQKKYLSTLSYKQNYLINETYENREIYEKKVYSDVINNTCDPYASNYSCKTSEKQALTALILMDAEYSIKYTEPYFFDISFNGETNLLQTSELKAKGFGRIKNPVLNYKKITDIAWNQKNLSIQNFNATLDGSLFNEEGIYEFYINFSGNKNFPINNGTIKKVFNSKVQKLNETISKFLDEDTLFYCDVNSKKINYPEFSCRMEYMQGKMMIAYSEASYMSNSILLSSILKNLSTSRIDETNSTNNPEGRYQTCDHTYNDFKCDDINIDYQDNNLKRNATYKQAILISSFAESYRNLNDETIKKTMHAYALNQTENCKVWEGEYDCKNDQDQALMIIAYANAYKATGDTRFFNIAINLANQNLSRNSSINLVMAYSLLFELTGNSTYNQKIIDLVDANSQICNDNTCSIEIYSDTITSFFEAFKQTGIPYIGDYASSKGSYNPVTTNNMCNRLNIDPIGSICEFPDQKGDTISALLAEYNTYFPINKSYSVGLTVPANANFKEIFGISCKITNTGNSTTTQIPITLSTSMDVLSLTSQNNSRFNVSTKILSSLGASESFSVNYTINATKGEKQEIFCMADNKNRFSNTFFIQINNIGNSINLSYNNLSGGYVGNEKTFEYTLKNEYNFTITNITINFTEFSSGLSLISINASETILSNDSTSITFSRIFGGANATFNLTVKPLSENNHNFSIKITNPYGISTSLMQYYSSYTDPFFVDIFAAVDPLQIYTYSSLNYAIRNNKNLTFTNLLLTLNKTNNIILINQTINTTLEYLKLNSTSFIINFTNNSEFFINEIYYLNESTTTLTSLDLSLDNYYISEIYELPLDSSDDHYILNSNIPDTFEINVETPFELIIYQTSNFNVSNQTILITSSNLSIITNKGIVYTGNFTNTSSSYLLDSFDSNQNFSILFYITLTDYEDQEINITLINLNNQTLIYNIPIIPYIPPVDNGGGNDPPAPSGSGGGAPPNNDASSKNTITHTYSLEEVRSYVNSSLIIFNIDSSIKENISLITYKFLKNNFTITSNITGNKQEVKIIKISNITISNFTLNNIILFFNSSKTIKSDSLNQTDNFYYKFLSNNDTTANIILTYETNITSKNISKPLIILNLTEIKIINIIINENLSNNVTQPLVDELPVIITDSIPEEKVPFSVKFNETYNAVAYKINDLSSWIYLFSKNIALKSYYGTKNLFYTIKNYEWYRIVLLVLSIVLPLLIGSIIIIALRMERSKKYLLIKRLINKSIDHGNNLGNDINEIDKYLNRKIKYPTDSTFLQTYKLLITLNKLNQSISHFNELAKKEDEKSRNELAKKVETMISQKRLLIEKYHTYEEESDARKIDIHNLGNDDLKQEYFDNYIILKKGLIAYKNGDFSSVDKSLNEIVSYVGKKPKHKLDKSFLMNYKTLSTLSSLNKQINTHKIQIDLAKNKNNKKDINTLNANVDKLKKYEQELLKIIAE